MALCRQTPLASGDTRRSQGNSAYTGTETPAEYKDPFRGAAVADPVLGRCADLVKRGKADAANAKNGQVQMTSDGLLHATSHRHRHPHGAAEGSQRWYQNIGIANSRAEREALYESGAQTIRCREAERPCWSASAIAATSAARSFEQFFRRSMILAPGRPTAEGSWC